MDLLVVEAIQPVVILFLKTIIRWTLGWEMQEHRLFLVISKIVTALDLAIRYFQLEKK
jgi:hypothetical protein